MAAFELCFLGTGTSQGVPVVACQCRVCQSTDKKDKRLRSSAWIHNHQASIAIDAGPDFRYQLLRERVTKLDAILITHTHRDHIAGLDDVRPFNYLQKKPMDVFIHPEHISDLQTGFSYAFQKNKYPGLPSFSVYPIANKTFLASGIEITAFEVLHLKMKVLGFRMGNLSYITDANYIPPESLKTIIGSEILIINALRREKHISHYNLQEALEVIDYIKPKQAYLTHISHLMGRHSEVMQELPQGVELAYDGLKIAFGY